MDKAKVCYQDSPYCPWLFLVLMIVLGLQIYSRPNMLGSDPMVQCTSATLWTFWPEVQSTQSFIKLSTVSLLIVSIALNLLVRPLIALVIFGWCSPMVFLGTNRYCFTNAISCVSSIIALFSNSGIEQRLNRYLLAIVVILRGLSVRIQNSIEFLIVNIFCWFGLDHMLPA